MAAAARLKLTILLIGCAVAGLSWVVGQWRALRPALPSEFVRIGVDPSLPPFAFYENETLVGFEIDLAYTLAADIALDIQWVALGFDGLYDALRADRVDLIIAAVSPDPLRRSDALYSRPYYDAGLVLVSANAELVDMSNLAGRKLAYAYGSAAHSEANRWLRRISPFYTHPYEIPSIALDAVRLGAVDAALVSATDMQLYRRNHPAWMPATTSVTHQPFVIAVNPRLGVLAEALDRSLDRLEADGTLAALLRRWLY